MKVIVASAIVLLSLSSVAEAHRLSGSGNLLRRERSSVRAAHRLRRGTQLWRNDSGAPNTTVRHGVVSPERGQVGSSHHHRSRSVQRSVLDLSPAAASALGCRCTHHNVTATVMQMGSGGTVVASRGRQRVGVAAAMPTFVQPTGDIMRPMGMFGSTMAMAAAQRQNRRYRVRHYDRTVYPDEGASDRAQLPTTLRGRRSKRVFVLRKPEARNKLAIRKHLVCHPKGRHYRPLTDFGSGPCNTAVDLAPKRKKIDRLGQECLGDPFQGFPPHTVVAIGRDHDHWDVRPCRCLRQQFKTIIPGMLMSERIRINDAPPRH
jgi:hypothetical protein